MSRCQATEAVSQCIKHAGHNDDHLWEDAAWFADHRHDGIDVSWFPRDRAVNSWVKKHRLSRWEMCEVLREVSAIGTIQCVLEIGCHVGDSLRIWRECLDPYLLVGVQDTDELSERTAFDLAVVAIRGRSQEQSTYERVLEVIGPDGCRQSSEIDFLYIDGDHTLNALRQDWALYSRLVRPGGIAVLHDAVIRGNDTVDVYKLWPEIASQYRTKLLHDPIVPSTGVGIVFL